MPYKTGSWGIQAQERYRRRKGLRRLEPFDENGKKIISEKRRQHLQRLANVAKNNPSENQKRYFQRFADARRGKPNKWGVHSLETIAKIRESKLAEKNPMWRGDKVGLLALHEWVGNRIPKPALCGDCKKVPPYDLANISQKYLRDLSDWEWLCRRCHMLKDGRLKAFQERPRGKKK